MGNSSNYETRCKIDDFLRLNPDTDNSGATGHEFKAYSPEWYCLLVTNTIQPKSDCTECHPPSLVWPELESVTHMSSQDNRGWRVDQMFLGGSTRMVTQMLQCHHTQTPFVPLILSVNVCGSQEGRGTWLDTSLYLGEITSQIWDIGRSTACMEWCMCVWA